MENNKSLFNKDQSRREFIASAGTLGIGLVMPGPAISGNVHNYSNSSLIRQAGNSEDEKTRYNLLLEYSNTADLSPELKEEINDILPFIHNWALGRQRAIKSIDDSEEHSYLNNFFTKKGNFSQKPRNNSPLYPIWALYRARMLIWQVIEYGNLQQSSRKRKPYLEEALRLLQIANKAYPENKIIGMYLGRPTTWLTKVQNDPKAPDWANLVRENLEKIAQITCWWVNNRQLPNGEYGGGWGDDCEMWRWQVPALISFQDFELVDGQERLSRGMFEISSMKGGYLNHITDVEHTAENSADTITPMIHLQPQDSVWKQRALKLANLMEQIWTGRNKRGFLQFKSAYFDANRSRTSRPRGNCDTVYTLRTMQPTLLYWQRTGDKRLTRLFTAWMDTWVDATKRAEKGKPAGITPSAIHWPDGRVGGVGKHWWAPQIQPNNHYYAWPSTMGYLTNILLLTYYMTNNEKYLDPIRSMASILSHFSKSNHTQNYEPGTQGWCAQRMNGFLPETLGKYRLLTGDTQYDHLLAKNPYLNFRLENTLKPLNNRLQESAQAMRQNFESFTSENRWTDRTLAFGSHWLRYITDNSVPTVDSDLVYSAVTGDPGGPGYFPLNAVRWLTEPKQIAVLVKETDTENLVAEFYHFGDEERPMGAELYLLKKGQYHMKLNTSEGLQISNSTFKVEKRATKIEFHLPKQELCTLKIEKV